MSKPRDDDPSMAEILRRIRAHYAEEERLQEQGGVARTLHIELPN